MAAFTKCCYKCPDRWVTDNGRCHDTCEKYQQAQKEWEEVKAKEREGKNEHAQFLSYRIDVKEKNRRRYHNK